MTITARVSLSWMDTAMRTVSWENDSFKQINWHARVLVQVWRGTISVLEGEAYTLVRDGSVDGTGQGKTT